ncbi:MAG: winged helix-turn-helix domain-containing protein, partial [Vicinamibacteria bacterium]
MAARRVRFGDFEFDHRTLELYQRGKQLRVQGKPLLLLAALVERSSELLTREELRARLWPSDTYVDFDGNLNAAVRKLREALQDSAARPEFIETLPGRGYRFIGKLEIVEPKRDPDPPAPEPRRLRRFSPWLVVASVALAVTGAVVFRELSGRGRATLVVLPFDNLSGDPAQDHVAEGLRAELTAQLGGMSGRGVELLAQPQEASSADFVVAGSSRRDSTGLYVT